MATNTREQRLEVSANAEQKLWALLMWNGKSVRKIGQENWLPQWVHSAIRFVFDDDAIEVIKHLPDFATNRALIQVKSATEEDEYPSVTIEQASYRVALRLSKYVPVFLVWLFSDNRTFMGNWVKEIHPFESSTPRNEANGSHTPFFLVHKNELRKLVDFMDEL